ncbi:hypothetical protein H112_05733 [Trichophyton rubrum D6]|uniref:CFEM domain-containing protein n=3 Tax=Trichophyton TaxID=5550 RepID=F2SK95_TRIRC|nr:uncharacterized protein TERG_03448 [Trichophyton rubrum CBS 118892]EZF16287.1 hypothetical protein H100_05750 [Trichophyton rubrum MR850]EZF50931.1 hypothetical protein H103_05746 [Trichophyton rubrum CBS 288.86]EZF61646.1 hypothetical protein H104_05730 [Trichophyton rubrum CBS 289.86]EZF72187.1 hypothetical protein H105_05758 [Trichophyton soudanense CBS 452.61]EZF93615.1 hypothetical protein H113_05787 [Trichophyton rubrum MR1459]KDB32151.1 hypothetical protein H112_05733 [Trichophyton 
MMAAAALAIDLGPINNLPPCPKNCVYSGISKSREYGCPFPSPQCLCRNRGYQQYLHNCSQKCTPAERDQMRQAGTKLCVDAGVPPNFRRRNARPESVAEEDAEVQQFPTNIPGVPGLPSLPIPSVPLPSWVPTAIPTGLPTGLPNIPVPTAIPTFVPTAIPTLIPTAIPTVIPPIPSLPSIPGLPSLPRLPSIPGIPPIPTPAANEKTNQAKATPNSRVMRVKQEA